MRLTTPLLVTAALVSFACDGKGPEPARAAVVSPVPAAAALLNPSPEDRAVAAAEAGTPDVLTGRVLETMDAGGYTYLQVETVAGPAWAAVNQSKVTKGAHVTVVASVTMDSFESRTLGRRFDRIVFGTLETAGAGLDHGPPALAGPHAASVDGPADAGPIQVSRAAEPDGRTVAEVFAQGAALEGKRVAVRGKVVKFVPGVMGRNWLHVRDGSGSPARNDHDLTVTTSETAAVGDVVLLRGTVRKDLDFGAGYKYAVLVEEARLSAK